MLVQHMSFTDIVVILHSSVVALLLLSDTASHVLAKTFLPHHYAPSTDFSLVLSLFVDC